ncbi:helix-turn-helix transcriptional regulator [Mesorhizobium caraganae]|uniref:helix-turn-helix transcriptional regulator n=1 Tax=Mesorhizobium caraganae TaxID=483206 RepID=UPI001FEFDB97|nr:helix-turn-helix transcriptional regulator [Mesorhizobium caraganae]
MLALNNLPDVSAIASVMGQIGRPTLPEALDDMLARIAPFDLSAIFGFPFDARPLLLYDGYRQAAAPSALEAYLNGAYLLDPFYTACVQGWEPGLWRMRDLAPDRFFDSEFYGSTEIHPCVSMQPGSLVEEIGFLVPLEGGFNAVYSLMRLRGAPFSVTEKTGLQALEPVVRESIRSQWRDARATMRPPSLNDLMEKAFTTFCQDRLTYQQRRIVQLILRGHSNCSIGSIISVTEGTVKLHRQNIYKRLNISSQSELFALFIETLLPELAITSDRNGRPNQ